MTITNDERREVATRLRNLNEGMWSSYGEEYDDLRWACLCDRSEYCGMELKDRIADLIEPETERTCRNLSDEYCQFKCSNCGREFNTKSVYSFNCCPNCGAKIEQ